jgi:hypothetical protein
MTDYLAAPAAFRLEVPERYNYARDVVDAWAVREPGRLALLAVGPGGGDACRFSSGNIRRVELREREQATAAD